VSEVKRIEIYAKPMSEEMRQHMIEELGDFCWYIPVMLRSRGAGNVLRKLDIDKVDELNNLKSLGDYALMLFATAAIPVIGTIEHLNGNQLPEASDVSDMAEVQAELIDRMAELLGTTGDQVRAQNIAKLRQRFPDAYTDAAAEARADKGGADHLSS
jgi:hypothetical protein